MLEIASFTAPSATTAALSGADRIELCADYAAGGVTPLLSTLRAVRDSLRLIGVEESTCETKLESEDKDERVQINVMIRPRGGDFAYSPAEFEAMKMEILQFKKSGEVDGFVFGVLDAEDKVDKLRNAELVELAAPLPCTFHRAIDRVGDLDAAVETVIACGFKSILTSGGEKSAEGGAERVKLLQSKCGDQITFILGGGIRSANMVALKSRTGVEWVHSAAITKEGEEVDEEEVTSMVSLLRNA